MDRRCRRHKETNFLRELSARSNQVANFCARRGLKRGDHLLLLLGNVVPLWETMLAAMKLGVVVIPATTLLTPEELRDRLERGRARRIVVTRIRSRSAGLAGDELVASSSARRATTAGCRSSDADRAPASFAPDGPTNADDPMLLYFTSGTTAKPKLVRHSHRSYPVGALSTMYWLGLQPGDVHLNISSPGWAKHAWSSFFAPWNAGATGVRRQPAALRRQGAAGRPSAAAASPRCARRRRCGACSSRRSSRPARSLREVCGAGEPLNPEVIDQVKAAWGLTIRDGYGQTETTALVGNSPGQKVKAGAMGRPLPGYACRSPTPTARHARRARSRWCSTPSGPPA